MPGVTFTCTNCATQFPWNTDTEEPALCPKCGYYTIYNVTRNETNPAEANIAKGSSQPKLAHRHAPPSSAQASRVTGSSKEAKITEFTPIVKFALRSAYALALLTLIGLLPTITFVDSGRMYSSGPISSALAKGTPLLYALCCVMGAAIAAFLAKRAGRSLLWALPACCVPFIALPLLATAVQPKSRPIRLFDIFRSGWKSADPDVRRKAVEKVEDTDTLLGIAMKEPDVSVAKIAVERLPESALMKVVNSSESQCCRIAATRRITNEDDLKHIIKIIRNQAVQNAAAGRLSAASIKELALSSKDQGVLLAIVNRITDQDTMIRLAKTTATGEVFVRLIRKITDTSFLANVAKGHFDANARLAAIEKLSDETLLADIAGNGSNPFAVRKVAATKSGSPRLLRAIAQEEEQRHLERKRRKAEAARERKAEAARRKREAEAARVRRSQESAPATGQSLSQSDVLMAASEEYILAGMGTPEQLQKELVSGRLLDLFTFEQMARILARAQHESLRKEPGQGPSVTEFAVDESQGTLRSRKVGRLPAGKSRCPKCGWIFDTAKHTIASPKPHEMSEGAQVFLPNIQKTLREAGFSMPHLKCPQCATTWMENVEM